MLQRFLGYVCLEIDVVAMECPLVVQQDGVAAGRIESFVDHHSFVMQTVELLDFHKEMLHIEFRVTFKRRSVFLACQIPVPHLGVVH